MRSDTTAIHATAVVIREAGVVIRGPSGTGKSSLALLLIEDARRRGWFARPVGDDRLLLTRHGPALVAAPQPMIAGLIERRTQPLVRTRHEPRCRVKLLVELHASNAPLPRLPEEDVAIASTPGWDGIPCLRLQAPPHALWCGIVFDKLAAC